MLSLLRIKNLAIVEESEIEFDSGLSVLTGETGAGKSIVLKAIELLAGGRASSDIVRKDTERCSIEGLFQLTENQRKHLAQGHQVFADEWDQEELLIRRTIDASGRGKVYINDTLATVSLLQEISSFLIDITGQHSQQTLLEAPKHRALVDESGVPASLLESVHEKYTAWAHAVSDLQKLRENSSERAFYFDRIRAEHEELTQASLEIGERESLEQELVRLANVENIGAGIGQCLDLLSESESSVDDSLRRTQLELDEALKLDPSLEEVKGLIDSAAVEIREALFTLQEYQSSLEAEPERLEEIRGRVADLARLERKYRKDIGELIAYSDSISEELSEFDGSGLDEEKLQKKVDQARIELDAIEETLSAARKKAAEVLSKQIVSGLSQVGMKKARFKVDIESGSSGPFGRDKVSFSLAANPGEPFRPLAKVASGGELSRILLILKTVLQKKNAPVLQIFDEIDAGIGGAIAEIVGQKLKSLAKNSQVLLITHAPQIAALADQHYFAQKSVSSGRTISNVGRLEREERVKQIASMMAGKKVTTEFEKSARQLLEANK